MKKFYFLLLALCFITSTQAQIINFPDANFKNLLIQADTFYNLARDIYGNPMRIDINNNDEIEFSEALNVYELHLNWGYNISNLAGIQYFTNLRILNCNSNNLTYLNLSNLSNLRELDFGFNQLQTFSCNGLLSLKKISCRNNLLTSVSFNGSINLEELNCINNQISTLDLSNLTNLKSVNCANNLIIGSIDLSSALGLYSFYCDNNQISSLFVKNGSIETTFSFSNNQNLRYLCVDEGQISFVQNKIAQYGYANSHTNSYCSFTPGGNFYTIQGSNKFDLNENGCDFSDLSITNLKYNITNGSLTSSIISNISGDYSIPVQAGIHTVAPILENPSFFNVSPASATATFPTQSNPFIQNFCLSANGVHPDLEAVLLPTSPARPGFNSHYALVYKNKGNQVQSGSIALTFDDSKLDLVSSSPSSDLQALNTLTWNYTNLQPFETRTINVVMHINAPTDTPAVNVGDQLNLTAVITPTIGDEITFDNTSAIKQNVIGSYDPNDKTCLEGVTIAPSEVGKYVHYMIRFENTGTYPAENVVVKDMIDTNKFDINSLVPLKGSHPFVTNITNGNKVEFIFENINLPFDDANNDGYVAFKIETKPTLVNGDTFSNSASIYFDYNFPIVTNTAVTTIQALSSQDFAFGTYFTVYPNPVNNVLNIETKQTIEVSSVSIYNQLGQLVLVIPNAQNTKSVDVSSLSAGNYFIKINSDKGTSNAKFFKK